MVLIPGKGHELQKIQSTLEQLPDKQLSLTDPDARLMKTHHMNRQVCYNVQAAVDTKHHQIVAHEVTNTTDRGQLLAVTKLTQEAVGQKNMSVLADKGYYSRKDIKAIQDEGVTAMIPKGDTSSADGKGLFNRSAFKYDREHLTAQPSNMIASRIYTSARQDRNYRTASP